VPAERESLPIHPDPLQPIARPSSRPGLRAALDLLYEACGRLAAVSLILIGVFVFAQVLGRLVGVSLPGTDDLAGYAMASSAFLGLAHTFNRGAHVRVTLLLDQLAPVRQRYLEIIALLLGAATVGFFLWYTVDLTVESARLGEVSVGLLKIPTAVPQGFMSLGVTALFVALLDSLVRVLRGQVPEYALHQGEEG
jgi:TRAP-type C4-dicarboxylate transport system permease small subunit